MGKRAGMYLSSLVLLVVISTSVWSIWNFELIPSTDSVTIYAQKKICENDQCRWVAMRRFTFHADPKTQSVKYWPTNEEARIKHFKRCRVKDWKNWTCVRSVRKTAGIKDGKLHPPPDETIQHISKTAWWLKYWFPE